MVADMAVADMAVADMVLVVMVVADMAVAADMVAANLADTVADKVEDTVADKVADTVVGKVEDLEASAAPAVVTSPTKDRTSIHNCWSKFVRFCCVKKVNHQDVVVAVVSIFWVVEIYSKTNRRGSFRCLRSRWRIQQWTISSCDGN